MERTQLVSEETKSVSEPASEQPKQAPKFQAPKKKRKWLKGLILALVVLAAAGYMVYQFFAAEKQMLSGAYLPYEAQMRSMTVSVSGTGTVEPIHTCNVTTLVSGEVIEAPFEEGQTVQKGDVLFRIDAGDVENNIQQLQLNVRSAQLALDDLLETQRENLGELEIQSEESGLVTEVHVEIGDTVTMGTPIADVLDREHMKLTVPFHAVDAAGFSVGQQATVAVDGTAGTISGVVDEIAVTEETGPGGTVVRQVTLMVDNPGILSDTTRGTAAVGEAACVSGGTFDYGASGQILSDLSGKLETLIIQKGTLVTEGQVVATIEAADLDTQIENARIALENAQLSLKNAQEKLDDYTITSTITGQVIEKNLDVGDKVSGMSSAGYGAVIYDLSQLTFDLDIDELDISKIQVGQKVEITADALDGQSFTGVVDKININGTTVNGSTSYPVTVLVDGTPEELYPGMNVSANIIVEEAGEVLTIPVEAVEQGNVVLVAGEGYFDEEGKIADPTAVEERTVTLGRNDSEYIEIVDGLTAGEVVLALSPQGSSFMSTMMGMRP